MTRDRDSTLLDEIGRALAARRDTLVAEIRAKLVEAGSERIAPDAVTTTDGGDKALIDLASELDLAQVQRDLAELRDVEAAQARLADGSYGSCADCGEPIARARLRVWPTAKRCTPCQEAHERQAGGAGGARL